MANLEIEITVTSAKDLINVNWRHGILKPYAVVWVDRNNYKSSTRVDDSSDTSPYWDQTLTIPLNAPNIDDSFLYIDIVHSGSLDDNISPLVGWARLALRDIVFDDVGFGECVTRMLDVKRPSGRPQGKLDVRVSVRERQRYNYMHDPYYAASISNYRSQMPPPGHEYVAAAPYGRLPLQTPDYGSGSQVAQLEANKGRQAAAQEAKKGSYKLGGIGTVLAVGGVTFAVGVGVGAGAGEGEGALADTIVEVAHTLGFSAVIVACAAIWFCYMIDKEISRECPIDGKLALADKTANKKGKGADDKADNDN